MVRPTSRGKEIRRFILESVSNHPLDVVRVTGNRFSLTRQAVNRYIHQLLDEGLISAEGNTSRRRYSLRPLRDERFTVPLKELEEDRLWRERVAQYLQGLPANVIDIWHYAFTEMTNNAIDHSEGTILIVAMRADVMNTEIIIMDDGIGIFRKISEALHLEDERHAVLELTKGKVTTDPDHHTGEGIFFTSRMLDDFAILSGDVYFSHEFGEDEDWIMEVDRPPTGTSVFMVLKNDSKRTDKEVFDQFASEEEDYGFTKTIVPVRLARHGTEKLVSRSQAKRLLSRVDRFTTVILDFKEVPSVGRAFADEIFRVFKRSHPHILLIATNTVPEVERAIQQAGREA